jgi:hypothetical protein
MAKPRRHFWPLLTTRSFPAGVWPLLTARNLLGAVSAQGVRTDGIGGFARTFLLAAFRYVGEGGDDPHGHLARYVNGVVAGTGRVGRDDAESYPVIGHIGPTGSPTSRPPRSP